MCISRLFAMQSPDMEKSSSDTEDVMISGNIVKIDQAIPLLDSGRPRTLASIIQAFCCRCNLLFPAFQEEDHKRWHQALEFLNEEIAKFKAKEK